MTLREIGRIERTIFNLAWLQNVELRRRVKAGLNKGEAKNVLSFSIYLRVGRNSDENGQIAI
ncbi:Transposase (plasmid) [Candidatus Protochlamydia naegleriophila]|uniref:Transposase n=1 Tax=Candidatus Protochlamydia naegleriophila TaxID=389348 RepID=A0A0U5K7I0_9BACT|nr:Transposase [Candidatus Protochlamydia naegleriophila]